MRDDHRGQCLYCGLYIPSGSDFCSVSCEAYFSCLGSEDLHEEPKNNIDAYGIFTVDLWASGNFTIDTIRNMDEKEGAFKSLAIFNLEPSEVIAANVRKLESRKARGTIRGSGDNR